jgi:hypothetical protein
MKVAVRRSTTKVSSLVGALAVLGTLLFAASALAAGKEGARGATGATGPTGPAGANGTNGANGANGANGTNGSGGGTEKNAAACEKGTPTEGCTLASGYQETGMWTVHIAAPTGAPQQQYESPISFPVRLKKGNLVKASYLTSRQSEIPGSVPGCLGLPIEPKAEKGHLCVYRGYADKGALESQDQNAAFFGFTDAIGELFAVSAKVGVLGEKVIFRSVNNTPSFKEETPLPGEALFGTITESAYMEGGGSWAVTEN